MGIFLILIIGFKVQNRYPKRFLGDHDDIIQILMKYQFSKKLSSYITALKYFKNVNGADDSKLDSTKVIRVE